MKAIIYALAGVTLLSWALWGCAGRPAPCTPEALAALEAATELAALRLIDSGVCDAHERIEQCPAYLAFEAGTAPAFAELRRCAK